MPQKIQQCRICGNSQLELVLDLGTQYLTGVFPASSDQHVNQGPLRLVKCHGEGFCGLLQLQHSYDLDEMYGENYGYRSGLNNAMMRHLDEKIQRILTQHSLPPNSLVIDIGANDGTTLRSYPESGLELVGVDPTSKKFEQYFPKHATMIADFFTADLIEAKFSDKKASIVTSFSMFYDLEDPMRFMRDIHSVLEEGGIWVFEQSYMPTMLDMNSYDTACHEHLEYYAMKQIAWMADRVGFSLIDVELNDVNGGSFSITAKKSSNIEHDAKVAALIEQEEQAGLDTLTPYREFAKRVDDTRTALIDFFDQAAREGKRVCALGASTKGNVLLQYCGVTTTQIAQVGEVNEDKFDKYTPGTLLPIVPEAQMLDEGFDYHLVLPWHFRSFFLASPHLKGKTLVFPLPEIELHVV
ncbi:MAG: class I SAM-dependent methyltransferase [Halioglobus sp.]